MKLKYDMNKFMNKINESIEKNKGTNFDIISSFDHSFEFKGFSFCQKMIKMKDDEYIDFKKMMTVYHNKHNLESRDMFKRLGENYFCITVSDKDKFAYKELFFDVKEVIDEDDIYDVYLVNSSDYSYTYDHDFIKGMIENKIIIGSHEKIDWVNVICTYDIDDDELLAIDEIMSKTYVFGEIERKNTDKKTRQFYNPYDSDDDYDDPDDEPDVLKQFMIGTLWDFICIKYKLSSYLIEKIFDKVPIWLLAEYQELNENQIDKCLECKNHLTKIITLLCKYQKMTTRQIISLIKHTNIDNVRDLILKHQCLDTECIKSMKIITSSDKLQLAINKNMLWNEKKICAIRDKISCVQDLGKEYILKYNHKSKWVKLVNIYFEPRVCLNTINTLGLGVWIFTKDELYSIVMKYQNKPKDKKGFIDMKIVFNK